MQLNQITDSIWTIDNFLSDEECEQLISFSEGAGYEEATISFSSGAKMMKGVRDNFRSNVDDEELAKMFWEKLESFVPAQIEDMKALGLNEHFRFYRYSDGQKFKRHIDGRFKRNENEESRVTFMIYLNENFEGGATAFDDVAIEPKTGTALCFIHELKHEGCPVTEGFKYVLRSDVMYRRKAAN